MSGLFVVRDCRVEDHPRVTALWAAVFPGSAGHNEPKQSLDRKWATGDGLLFVAEAEGEIVGAVMAGYDGHRGWIYSLAVAATARRQGVGSALMRHAEHSLVDLGCLKINLQVRAENAEVVAFYQALGYVVEQRVSMGKRVL